MTVADLSAADHQLAERLGALRVGPQVLATGAPEGPLVGVPMVVKDLIDVAGVATGAGTPAFLAGATPALINAPAVARLLAAGATVIGKSHTDELAFSLSGTNVHYGTPLNPAAPLHIPGGSSSGSASAVAGGLVPLALATDTGGSIRVPASYCGIFGFRPTHGRVPLDGVVEFAPSFGTVGVLAATGPILAAGGAALIAPDPDPASASGMGVSPATKNRSTSAVFGTWGSASARPSVFVIAEDLLGEADGPVGAAVGEAARRLAADLGVAVSAGDFSAGRLGGWFSAFRGRQLVEAWRSHGPWIERCQPNLGPGVAARFAQAKQTPEAAAEAAGPAGEEIRAALDALVAPGGVLVLPSAASVAPLITLAGPAKDDLRLRTLRLTCVAGLGGLPAVSLPLAAVDGLAVGVCLVACRGEDELLLATARCCP